MSETINPPQSYFCSLLEQANQFLEEKDYAQVIDKILNSHDNLQSGWTSEIHEMYSTPKTLYEKMLADKMSVVIERTVAGLLETAQPTTEPNEYITLERSAVQLYRLGNRAQQEMITRTRQLIEKSQEMGAPEKLGVTIPSLEYLNWLEEERLWT